MPKSSTGVEGGREGGREEREGRFMVISICSPDPSKIGFSKNIAAATRTRLPPASWLENARRATVPSKVEIVVRLS